MYAAPVSLALRMRERIESKALAHGLVYPWWIAVVSASAQVFCVAMGLAQRGAWLPPQPITLVLLLVLLPHLGHLLARQWQPWWVGSLCVLLAAGWLLAEPLDVGGPADTAAVVVAFLAAEVTATDGMGPGLVVSAASIALLIGVDLATGLPGAGVYALEVALGMVVGYMIRWQMRALAAERAASAGERERATLAERQRIAREIHDLVAHSLSVTLLHVTGARRALSEDRDVDEAIDALRDAENVGRQAMADIRRTVGVLATETSGVQPLPGASDVARLVEDFRGAGLEVGYTEVGDLASLTSATGLGIYRIAQESLANVAKHAPGVAADVRLMLDDTGVRLGVRNPVPAGAKRSGDGSGLAGMASRAEQLGGRVAAGRQGEEWVVDLAIPIDRACLVRRILP